MSNKPNKKTSDSKAKADEILAKIEKAEKDRDSKLKAAVSQLAEQLAVTADKYRTATGVREALGALRLVTDGKRPDVSIYNELEDARDLATYMVTEANRLADLARNLEPSKMDELCKGAYEEDFINAPTTPIDFAQELLRLDLCRNIGPAAEDIKSFKERADEEIKAMEAELAIAVKD